jgi:hypothetical protein
MRSTTLAAHAPRVSGGKILGRSLRSADTMNRTVVWRALPASMAAVAVTGAALGCSGGGAAANDARAACVPVDSPTACPSPPPSYNGEIKFVVANYCASAECHAPGGAASAQDFTTYQGLFRVHLTIAMQVGGCPSNGGMPPVDSRQLTAAQRLDLITWVSACKAVDN